MFPRAIPGYELLQSLGGGATTSVFVARDLVTDERVAVKALRSDGPEREIGLMLLRQEAEAGMSVRNTHLVGMRKALTLAAPFFLVMDLVPGEALRNLMHRHYRLPARSALWIARQAAEALCALHRAGFVHADVKPENVLVNENGDTVLIDLGFARRRGDSTGVVQSSLMLGTADYLAPERFDAVPLVDSFGDLFSLGVMLFEMLAGVLPFPAGSVTATLRAHGQARLATIEHVAADWPAGLPDLLRKLLARCPADRPSAADAIRDLVALEIAALKMHAA